MSNSSTLLSRIGRFDTVLLLASIIIGECVGISFAVLYNGYAVVLFLPIVALVFGLFGAVIAHRRRYLVAFSSVTALNMPWIIITSYKALLTDHSELTAFLKLVGLAWVSPLALLFFILWATRD